MKKALVKAKLSIFKKNTRRIFVLKCIKTTPKDFCWYVEGRVLKDNYVVHYKMRHDFPNGSKFIEDAELFFTRTNIEDFFNKFFETKNWTKRLFKYFQPIEVCLTEIN